ncbi:MAG: trypsin-like peptidase domain-containing protein [Ignavibacteriales bacterium]|nr:trypsin-like peptidase domain-containing protein [Ignavibacteriales bacterium]MCB9219808.1 trypsin-like peptidase domain-containing protein [Ignavibacteriales bacterium]
MKNFKVIFLSSFITILIISIVFAFFYYKDRQKTTIAQNAELVENSENPEKVENSSIVPVNLRAQANNQIYNSRENIITNTVKKISSAIVGINVTETRYVRDFFYRIYEQQIPGLGSGAIISSDGYIITNDHVAGNANQIVVTMTDGTEYNAELIGTDKSSDIALLKIDADNLPYLKFGNSDDILIGEWVIALGNPFGLFKVNDKPTVTVGVVSSLGMNLGVIKERYYLNMIQTDAAINSGNSGGPLVNSLGEMIGMNTIIWSEGGGSVGVGFAIPINTIKNISEELKTNGSIKRDFWTGISIHSIDKGIAKYYNLNSTYGVIVTKVERNSPGSKAGLKVGDVVLEINEIKIKDEDNMIYIFHQARTNDSLKLKVLRDNKTIFLNLKLESKYD